MGLRAVLRSPPPDSGGFTIVEMISVLIIAGILAAIAAPRLAATGQLSARGTAEQLTAAFHYAQLAAQRLDATVSVTIGAANFKVVQNGTAVSTSQGPYTVALPSGVTITPTGSNPVSTINYSADGTDDDANPHTFSVAAGKQAYTVTVEAGGMAHE